MSTRSLRRSTVVSTAARSKQDKELSNLDRLIVAQAVYEFGANSWSQIAKLLSKHPLLNRPKSFFTAASCHAMYDSLMKETGLQFVEEDNNPKSSGNYKLAARYYQERLEELRDLIATEDRQFKKISNEIEEIRAGAWDDKITASVKGSALQDSPLEYASPDGSEKDDKKLSEVPDGSQNAITPGNMSQEAIEEEDAIDSEQVQQEILNAEEHPSLSMDNEGHSHVSKPFESANDTSSNLHEDTNTTEAERIEEDAQSSSSGDQPLITAQATRSRRSSLASSVSHTTKKAPKTTSTRRSSRLSQDPEVTPAHDTPNPPFEDINEEDEDGDDDATPEDAAEAGPSSVRRQSKRKASPEESIDTPRDRKRAREDSVAEEQEEGGASSIYSRQQPRLTGAELRRFQNTIGNLHSQIHNNRYGSIFHYPIKTSEAPDYYDIIKRPTDLKTIKAKVKDGEIANSLEYQRDIYLMFANAIMYNRPGSDISSMTQDMMADCEKHIDDFRQAELMRS